MTIEVPVEGNKVNRIFNRIADGVAGIAERAKGRLTRPVYSTMDGNRS